MSLFDRLFRRRRGGTLSDAPTRTDSNPLIYTPIQVGGSEPSQQIDVDPQGDSGQDSGAADSGGGDFGGGGDSGGGGGE